MDLKKRILEWKCALLFFFLIIPIFLFLMPRGEEHIFVLRVSNITGLSIFFSNYTHWDLSHLLRNLAMYWGAIVLVFAIEADRKFFYKIASAVLLLLPFIASFAVLGVAPGLLPVQGFSVITSAFVGYLFYALYQHLKQHYKKLTFSFPSTLFLASALVCALKNEWISILTGAVLLLALLLFTPWEHLKKIYRSLKKRSFQEQFIIVATLVILILSMTFILPQEIITATGRINTLGHYIGFIFGIFMSFIVKALSQLKRPETLTIFGIFLTILSIWVAFYLSTPIELNMSHDVSEDGETLYIHIKNTDWFRDSGTVTLYRLEVSDSKPHMQLTGNRTLAPGKEETLTLRIKRSEERIELNQENFGFGMGFSIPSALFYITEKTSISYKITCDNCPPQGIVRRQPALGQMETLVKIININGSPVVSGALPIYEWVDYDIEDIQ